jgi:hypothetical protein
MKFCYKFTIFSSLFVLQFLLINTAQTQELQSISNSLSSDTKKYRSNEFKESFYNIEYYKNRKDFKIFKSIGVKLGLTTNEYGWHHPFPFISQNYFDDPGTGTGWVGGFIEGLSNNYISTIIDAAYRGKHLNFKYNLYNGNGEVIGTEEAGNTFNMASYCISEKFKFTKNTPQGDFGAYIFAGLRYNIISSGKFNERLANMLSTYESTTFGLNSGVGVFAGKKVYVSIDFYFAPDFSKTYSTQNGYYKNTEFGIVLAIGYNNF